MQPNVFFMDIHARNVLVIKLKLLYGKDSKSVFSSINTLTFTFSSMQMCIFTGFEKENV